MSLTAESRFFELLSLALRETDDVAVAVEAATVALGGVASEDTGMPPQAGSPGALPPSAMFGYVTHQQFGRVWAGKTPPGDPAGWAPAGEGPKKGKFWKRVEGRKRSLPGQAKQAQQTGQQPGQGTTPVKPGRLTDEQIEQVAQSVEQTAMTGNIQEKDVHALRDQLLSMSVKEIQAFKKRFTLRASGNKAKLALDVAKRALDQAQAKLGGKKPANLPGGQPPTPQQPATPPPAPVAPPVAPPIPEPAPAAPPPTAPETPQATPAPQPVPKTPPEAPPAAETPKAPEPAEQVEQKAAEEQDEVRGTLESGDEMKIVNLNDRSMRKFIGAAQGGLHGSKVQEAVDAVLNDWKSWQGDPKKQRLAIAKELAKLRQPEPEETVPEPPPQAAPTPETPLAAEPERFAAAPDAASFSAGFARDLDKTTHLSPEQKKAYQEAGDKVFKAMPKAALERAQASLKKVSFYTDTKALTDEYLREAEEKQKTDPTDKRQKKLQQLQDLVKRGGAVAGVFNKKTGRMRGDGMSPMEEIGGPGKRPSIEGAYAHELTHAIDFGDSGETGEISLTGEGAGPLSDNKEWQQAWDAEMGGGNFTKYARTSPSEGFAEFGRALYAGDADAETLERFYPKSTAFFKKHGLMEAASGQAGTEEAGHPGTVQSEPRDAGRGDSGHGDARGGAGGAGGVAPEEPVTPESPAKQSGHAATATKLADAGNFKNDAEKSGADRLRMMASQVNSGKPVKHGEIKAYLDSYARPKGTVRQEYKDALNGMGKELIGRLDEKGKRELFDSYESELKSQNGQSPQDIPQAVKDMIIKDFGDEVISVKEGGAWLERIASGLVDGDKTTSKRTSGKGRPAAKDTTPVKQVPKDQQQVLSKVHKAAQERDFNDAMRELGGVNIEDRLDEPSFGGTPGTFKKHEKVFEQFDAHGTNTLESLEKLLNGGIEPDREFFTSPLSGASASNSGYGVTVRANSPFYVLGHPGKTLKEGGIAAVMVDPLHEESIPDLEKAFPGVHFLSVKEAPETLGKVAGKYRGGVKYK